MKSINYTNARAQLSSLMDQVYFGQAIEITRKDREPVILISKKAYEAYKKAESEHKLLSLVNPNHE